MTRLQTTVDGPPVTFSGEPSFFDKREIRGFTRGMNFARGEEERKVLD